MDTRLLALLSLIWTLPDYTTVADLRRKIVRAKAGVE
jgi:hypothetical protein